MGQACRLGLLWLVGLMAFPVAWAKDTDKPVVDGELGRKLDESVATAGGGDFWGSVLVARKGRIVLAKGYGASDYVEMPNTPRTLFELASASKQVTATAILHLCQRKKLSVDDTLDRVFDHVPDDKKPITVHHLLTHTSGISGNIGVPYASPLPRKRYVEQMLAEPLAHAPGEAFEYCNVGYALLAAIVEEVSKDGFEEYVERHLLKPAGCSDTGFINDRDLVHHERVARRKGERAAAGEATASNWHWGWGYRGMGGVVTSVLDLLRWDQALRTDKILSEASRTILHTPRLAQYACGWHVETTPRGTRKAHHSGSVAGFGAQVVRYLEEDVFVCVLSNDGRKAVEVATAFETLLFEPVALEAELDWQAYDLPASRVHRLPGSPAFDVRKTRGDVRLELRDGKHVLLRATMPATYATALLASLDQAIAARTADDAGEPAAVEATLYLQPYPGVRTTRLTEKVDLQVRPEYRFQDEHGKTGVDLRTLLVLVDGRRGQWPLMALLNLAAAQALRAELAGAVPPPAAR